MNNVWFEKYIASIDDRLEKIEKAVDTLVADKNKRKGISIAITTAVSIGVSLLVAYFERK